MSVLLGNVEKQESEPQGNLRATRTGRPFVSASRFVQERCCPCLAEPLAPRHKSLGISSREPKPSQTGSKARDIAVLRSKGLIPEFALFGGGSTRRARMKARYFIGPIILLVLAACCLVFKWKHDELRRQSLATLQHLRVALDARSAEMLDDIVLPTALAGRTPSEQTDFLTKALQGEVSMNGIAALQKEASFGPLNQLFPEEAAGWAKQAGVNPDDCIAFRMERNGIRAEVVLIPDGSRFRIVRCNNV